MNLEDIYHEEGQDQDYEQAEYDNYLYSMGFFDLKVIGKPKTLAQLQAITQQVDWKVNTISNKKDLPF